MAKIVVLPKPEAPDGLGARRAELIAEASRLGKVAEARAAAERRLADLDAEQMAIDQAEREQKMWAATAGGPPPSPRTKEREDIAHRRVLIAGDLQAATLGQQAVEPRLATLNAELRELGRDFRSRPSRRSCARPTRSMARPRGGEGVSRRRRAGGRHARRCDRGGVARGQRSRSRARGDPARRVLAHRAARATELAGDATIRSPRLNGFSPRPRGKG